MKIFNVQLVAQGVDFRYTPKVKILADNQEEAEKKAVKQVERDMCIDRALINVKNVEEEEEGKDLSF